MDGNILLIKMIQERPSIWMNNCDSKHGEVKRMQNYEDISKILGTNSNWIISQWNMLRNRFYKEYKTAHDNKNTYRIKFKYFKNMMFLAHNLRIRKIPDFKTKNSKDDISYQFNANNRPEFVIGETALKSWSTNSNYFAFNESNDNYTEITSTQQDKKENYDTNNKNRSEDIIFGELITAMLKDMPTEKKKLVKKEIMNIMLS